MTFHVNQRVQTPLGPGTILGFENFNSKGSSNPDMDTDPNNGFRVHVRLDEPKNWLAPPGQPDPYMNRSELQELKEAGC